MADRGRTILMVEDDESLRRIVARHLRGLGYEVVEAASAEAAEAELRPGRPSGRGAARPEPAR